MGHSGRAGWIAVWIGLALGGYCGSGSSVVVGLQDEPTSEPVAVSEAPVLALVGAQVLHLEPLVRLEPQTVLVVGDRIAAVGADVTIPEGAQRVDLSGLVLSPGLIDAHSRLWLMPDAAGQSGRDARLSAVDGLDAFAEDWSAVVAQGVTAVYVQPGTADICAGTGVVLSAVPELGPSLKLLRADAALQAALGTGGANSGKACRRQAEALEKLLSDARQYQKQWEEYRRQLAEWEKSRAPEAEAAASESEAGSGPEAGGDRATRRGGARDGGQRRPTGGPGRRPEAQSSLVSPDDDSPGEESDSNLPAVTGFSAAEDPPAPSGESNSSSGDREPSAETAAKQAPKAPAVDLAKERLVKVLEGALPLRLQVNHPDDIERGLSLAEKYGVRLVLEGLADVGPIESRLSEQRWPAVLGAWLEPAVTAEQARRRSAWVRLWGESDRLLAITAGGSSPGSSSALRANAAAAIAAGVDPDQALRAITLGAARILGVEQEIGSIEVGKRADLVALTGHPLAASSRVSQVWVAGREIPLVCDPPTAEERPAGEVTDRRFDWQPPETGWVERLPRELPERYRLTSERLLLPDGEVAAGTLWIERGRITRVELEDERGGLGDPDSEPSLPQVIDLGPMWVTPGLVDCHHVPPAAASLIDEPGEADARQLRAVDAIDPSWPELRHRVRQGQLVSWLAPGGRNVLSGRVGAVRWGPQLDVLSPDIADKWVLAASARDVERFPASLLGQRQMLEQLLSGEPAVTRLYLPPTIQRAWADQRRTEVEQLAAGERWVIVQANSPAERRVVVELAQEHGLRVAVVGLRDIGSAIDGLVAAKAAMIARPLGEGEDLRYVRELVRASEAGVEVLWSFRSVPALQWTLGQAVGEGMPPQQAFRSVTSAAVQTFSGLFGAGVLESGSAADLVVWDGPLHDVRSRPRRVMLGGQWAPDDWQPGGE